MPLYEQILEARFTFEREHSKPPQYITMGADTFKSLHAEKCGATGMPVVWHGAKLLRVCGMAITVTEPVNGELFELS